MFSKSFQVNNDVESKITNLKRKRFDEIYCMSVNDSFVMNVAQKRTIKNVK